MYGIEVVSCGIICNQSYMKISIGIQAILRFCLSNLTGCNVSIIDGKELCNAPLRWTQVA